MKSLYKNCTVSVHRRLCYILFLCLTIIHLLNHYVSTYIGLNKTFGKNCWQFLRCVFWPPRRRSRRRRGSAAPPRTAGLWSRETPLRLQQCALLKSLSHEIIIAFKWNCWIGLPSNSTLYATHHVPKPTLIRIIVFKGLSQRMSQNMSANTQIMKWRFLGSKCLTQFLFKVSSYNSGSGTIYVRGVKFKRTEKVPSHIFGMSKPSENN
jgi:hypothetical protein